MKVEKSSAEEKNADVLAALKGKPSGLSPTEIALRIGKPWCFPISPIYPSTAAVSAVLKRIGAVKLRRGVWVAPAEDLTP